MSDALTETTWLKVLDHIIDGSPSDTARTLAYMLRDIIKAPDDLGEILDAYGSNMLERTA